MKIKANHQPGMNERIRKLREQSVNTVPTISIERAVLMTEAYQKYQGKVSIPVLRALSFKHLCENKTVVILDGELIVGERGPKPQSAPTYPELCCHTIEDFEVMDQRDKIFFKVSDEAKKIQEEVIIPFWQGKAIRDLIMEQMTPEWHDCYEAGIFTEFMEQRSPVIQFVTIKYIPRVCWILKPRLRNSLISWILSMISRLMTNRKS